MDETLEAIYSIDTVDLRLREALDNLVSYLLAGPVNTVTIAQENTPTLKPKLLPKLISPKPMPVKPRPVPAKQKPGTLVEIGNRDFPALV